MNNGRRNINIGRVITGVIVAPLVPGLLVALLSLILGERGMALWYLQFAAILGYTAILILGIPLHLLFRRWHWVGVLSYILLGAILGAALCLISIVPGLISEPSGALSALGDVLIFMPLGAFFGAIAGLSFWLIAAPHK